MKLQWRSEKFKRRGPKFPHFFKRIFLGGTNLKLIEKQRKVRGRSGGMLPQKNFENLHVVMAILVLFE